MGKILVVAEKPSVGRDIAKVLKCTTKGDGYLYSDHYVISWAIGHLVTLYEPEDYDLSLKKWNFKNLPITPSEIKTKPVENTKKQFNLLKKLMKQKEIDEIICATDSGREGELIFRYIYDLVGCTKPFKRLWISSMTDVAIKEGFQNLKDSSEYDNLYLSAKCRSEADWLVGINASRAYTLKYDALLSIGRVQTPTLAILVERQKEINLFVPEQYWEVQAFFENYKGMWVNIANNFDTKIKNKEQAYLIKEKIINETAVISKIENEEKKQPPNLLYDLTELQRDCNRKFGYSAQKTLSIAQDLYEKRKLITYPRTDSRYLSDDYIPKIKPTLNKFKIEPYSKQVEYILSLVKLPINKRIVDNTKITDHHAIVPTGASINMKSLSGDEFNVFDLVVRRFISVFLPNYIYNVTKIFTIVEEETFLTKGTTIIQLGFMELYKDDKKDKTVEDEELLPAVHENDKTRVVDSKVFDKKTKPPKLYTEATLLSAMENAGRFVENEDIKESLKDSGLGTPATRASIIERIIYVSYVERKGKNLVPTDKGMKLIEILPSELKSPETTGKWEKGLSSISKGKLDNKKFMNSINKYVNFIIEHSSKVNNTIVFEKEKPQVKSQHTSLKSLGSCPACKNGSIFENTKAFYCGDWKRGCKFTIWKNCLERYGYQITTETVALLLKNNKVDTLPIVLPQTMEKCTADLVFNHRNESHVELINVTKILKLEE